MRALFLLFAVLALVFAVDAREDRVARLKRQLLTRQAPFNGPTTVTTTRSVETFAGTVVETCNITLTPITVNGQNMVKEERNCTAQLVRPSSALPVTTTFPADSSTSATQTATSAGSSSSAGSARSTSTFFVTVTAGSTATSVATSVTSSTTLASTSVATTTSVASSTTSVATSSAKASATSVATSTSAAVTSAASSTTTSAASSATTSAASQGAGEPAKEIGTQTKSIFQATTSAAATAAPVQAPTSTTSTSTSATAAQAEASASTTPFTLPGKKLEVLPIGLGVFAGISVIALIVVALVTYERTKYRKAFRQRKLAEQGAGMGYNGMSERV